MLNWFSVKKWAALLVNILMPVIFFFVGIQFYGFWVGLGCLLVAGIVSFLLANMLLKNPFTEMIEGKGLLCINIDSTGVLRPFIVALNQPYIKGALDKNTPVNDVYDRSAVLQMSNPLKTGRASLMGDKIEIDLDGEKTTLSEKEFNAARFGLWQYPVLIYNNQIKSLVTKDDLSNTEKDSFAEHGVLYLNRKLEELTSTLRDFGRYIVELTKPKGSFIGSSWFWIIIVILFIVLGLLFARPLFNVISGAASSSSGIMSNLNPVIPR